MVVKASISPAAQGNFMSEMLNNQNTKFRDMGRHDIHGLT
jgi:hypothetical protein